MSDVCVMCTWYTLSAGAPDDRPRAPPGAAGPHRAFAGFGPRGPFSLAFGVRAVSAVSGPGPAAAGELAAFSYPRVHVDTHSSNPCVRVVTPVQRRVSAAVRQGPTTPTRRPHASGQVINGSCALPARGAGASVPRTHMPTCASRDPLEPAVLRAVARQQVCANLRHRKRRHRGISYSRI
jgi:hypothetical protein